jgi:hypothetical protein
MHTRTPHRVGRLIILTSKLDKPRTDSLSTRARTCTTTSLYTTILYDNPSAVVSTAYILSISLNRSLYYESSILVCQFSRATALKVTENCAPPPSANAVFVREIQLLCQRDYGVVPASPIVILAFDALIDPQEKLTQSSR